MSLVVILALALVLTTAGRLLRFAVRIGLLIVLIALAVNYGAHVTHRHDRRPAPTPAIQPSQPR